MSAHDEYLERQAAASLGMSYEEYAGQERTVERDPDEYREMRLERDPFDWIDDEYGRSHD